VIAALPKPRLTAIVFQGESTNRLVVLGPERDDVTAVVAAPAPARNTRKPTRCTSCGADGHNRRNPTCPTRIRGAR